MWDRQTRLNPSSPLSLSRVPYLAHQAYCLFYSAPLSERAALSLNKIMTTIVRCRLPTVGVRRRALWSGGSCTTAKADRFFTPSISVAVKTPHHMQHRQLCASPCINNGMKGLSVDYLVTMRSFSSKVDGDASKMEDTNQVS